MRFRVVLLLTLILAFVCVGSASAYQPVSHATPGYIYKGTDRCYDGCPVPSSLEVTMSATSGAHYVTSPQLPEHALNYFGIAGGKVPGSGWPGTCYAGRDSSGGCNIEWLQFGIEIGQSCSYRWSQPEIYLETVPTLVHPNPCSDPAIHIYDLGPAGTASHSFKFVNNGNNSWSAVLDGVTKATVTMAANIPMAYISSDHEDFDYDQLADSMGATLTSFRINGSLVSWDYYHSTNCGTNNYMPQPGCNPWQIDWGWCSDLVWRCTVSEYLPNAKQVLMRPTKNNVARFIPNTL